MVNNFATLVVVRFAASSGKSWRTTASAIGEPGPSGWQKRKVYAINTDEDCVQKYAAENSKASGLKAVHRSLNLERLNIQINLQCKICKSFSDAKISRYTILLNYPPQEK